MRKAAKTRFSKEAKYPMSRQAPPLIIIMLGG
jgi:hypothetical protein